MNVYKNIDEIKFNKSNILTVGTFDGVHLGHQHVINDLKKYSEQNNLTPLLITIDPHPQIVLNKKPDFTLLTNIDERLYLLNKFGIENIFVIPFDKSFSEISPVDFVKEYLFNKIGFSHILIGYDHFFGKNRGGDKNLLDNLSLELDFKVDMVSELENNEHKISSSSIRKLIASGDLEVANQLLGYSYLVSGEVVVGDKRGRTIGLPTANIEPDNSIKLIPLNGVYFASSIIKGQKYYGMCNIGLRPTFTDGIKRTIETNFFDFNDEIYGENLNIEFHKFIRNEQKFNNLSAFLEQISKDKEVCKSLIK